MELIVVIMFPIFVAIAIAFCLFVIGRPVHVNNSARPTADAIKEIDDRWTATWQRREQEIVDTYESELIGLSGQLQQQLSLVEQYKKSDDIQSRLIAELQGKLQSITEISSPHYGI